MYNVHCTLYNVHIILMHLHCTMYNVHALICIYLYLIDILFVSFFYSWWRIWNSNIISNLAFYFNSNLRCIILYILVYTLYTTLL